MSAPDDPAGDDGVRSGAEHQGAEQSEEQLRSAEAARYRQRAHEAEAGQSALQEQLTQAAAQIEALQRDQAEGLLRGKLNDPKDFWLSTDVADVRNDAGTIDVGKLNAKADELLAEHPHWRAPSGLASSSQINSRGVVGGRPRNILDGDNVQPETTRGWAEFLTDAARGDVRPPTH